MNSEKARKRKKNIHTLRRLVRLLLDHWGWILIGIALTFIGNFLDLQTPRLSGAAIDAMDRPDGVNLAAVIHYAKYMLLFYVLSTVINIVVSRIMIEASQRMTNRMRHSLFAKIISLKINFFDTHPTGDIISRMNYDVDTLNSTLSTDITSILTSSISVLGSLIMMLSISPELSSVLLITIPMAIGYTIYHAKRVKPLFTRRTAVLGDLNGLVEEIIPGQETIRIYNQEQVFTDQFARQNAVSAAAEYSASYQGSINGPVVSGINNLSLLLVTIFGAILYVNGMVTLGNISTFLLYSRRFSWPINNIATMIGDFQSTLSAAERIFEIYDTESESADTAENIEIDPQTIEGAIAFDRINFEYVPNQPVLRDLSFFAQPGKMTAIVGETGAGKTTISNLLPRFYDYQSGEIRLDGNEITELTRTSLRSAFAVVTQEPWIFEGTLRENLCFAGGDVSPEALDKACADAGLTDFIATLPEGYETVITNESNISQGQKQLIAIARAMLNPAPILVLDEATSNVDTITEMNIQAALARLLTGRTSIVIAHRLSTVQRADLIIVLSDGQIIESGTHTELIARRGNYYNLFRMQFT
ncbi:MAG: ABC transporter ATP-binding protein [Clostridiaceae bacterium]|nr:ABC transporter ATP-binding protein [Clostridiaceae bacterium]